MPLCFRHVNTLDLHDHKLLDTCVDNLKLESFDLIKQFQN